MRQNACCKGSLTGATASSGLHRRFDSEFRRSRPLAQCRARRRNVPSPVPSAGRSRLRRVSASRTNLMGDGKTALRGGWGIFYNRLDGNQYYGNSGQAPTSYNFGQRRYFARPDRGAKHRVRAQHQQSGDHSFRPHRLAQSSVGHGTECQSGPAAHICQQHRGRCRLHPQYIFNEHISGIDTNCIPIGTGWPFNP